MATSDDTVMTDPPAHHEVSTVDDFAAFTDPEIRSNQAQDLKFWKAELVRVTNAARHDSNDAESVNFLDGVLSQPALIQRLTALEILNQRLVSPYWAAWFRHNITTIASVRRQDDNHDWYFPIFDPVVQYPTPSLVSQLPSWPLSGIWHATANHSSKGLLQALPPLTFPLRPQYNCRQSSYHVIASSGGLLLVQLSYEECKRRQGIEIGCNSCREVEWCCPSLMVVNPLTKKLRVLPPFEVGRIRLWSTKYLVQCQIMVDDKENAYKVLLYSFARTCYYIYDSKSSSWQYERHIPTPTTEPKLGNGLMNHEHHGGVLYYASACVDKRLYFADIRRAVATDWETNGPDVAGVLRLLEMDINTGDWKPCKQIPLRKVHIGGVEIREVIGNRTFCHRCILRNLELVECMGHIFAVIPARIDEFLHPIDASHRIGLQNYSVPELKHMPLQFFVLQLDGEDVNGVVRIDVPTARRGCKYKTRRQSLFEKSLAKNQEKIKLGTQGNWFRCTAKGSMIWVSCEDYLVQYDVMSGQSKTQIIRKIDHKRVRFAYRASFHMTP